MCNPIYMLSDANILFINLLYILNCSILDLDISLHLVKKLTVKYDV